MELKHGTKVVMLNDCSIGHFKKGDILTIYESYVDGTYDCEEFYDKDGDERVYISADDKFKIVDLEIFENLGD